MSRYRFVAAGLVAVTLPAVALACLWDYDTLKQERARFPDTLELITGKFLRHSKEFYEWRIQDRLKKLEADPKNLAYYDDLAVAYDKTGNHDKAIETMLAKEKLQPGPYETYANLGTFYFHSGKLEDGLPYIDKALAINPDAHFGRERYQKWLVEYVISRRKEGKVPLPLQKVPDYPDSDPKGFTAFVASRLEPSQRNPLTTLTPEATEAAIKGVLGMMRFGKHDAPVLLEALGDLLAPHPYMRESAKRLSARCYLKASYAVTDEQSKADYRKLAEQALMLQLKDGLTHTQLKLSDLEQDFQIQLANAEEWYAALKGRELTWIRDSTDPEAEFDRLYTQDPVVPGEPSDAREYSPVRYIWANYWQVVLVAGATVFLLAFAAFYLIRRARRRL
jgi:tetratricopeptide (TPR) repeat protein